MPTLSPDQTESARILQTVAEVLAGSPEIHTAVVYGSAATGRLRPDSDVDVAVAGAGELSVDERYALHDKIARALGREVDLRDLTRLHGLILTQVLAKGRIVLKKNRGYLERRMAESVAYAQDIQPIIDRGRRRRIEEFIRDR
jgi:predicted nucleotidyltransferase